MTALRVASLTKRYGRTLAVDDVSLTVERGQVYGLLGPNGSGKTTALSCILGLLRPDGGLVEILGVPATSIHRTLGRVAAVFDKPTLVGGLSVAQNLEYARRLLGHDGGRPGGECLELVDMGPLARRRASRLSLGQRRRLSIARALIGRPELLVLDEPLSGLDTVGVRAMLRLFRRLADEGLTLILSSHRLHEMERIVSHVGILLRGRRVAQAPLDELLGGQRDRLVVRAGPTERVADVLARLDGLGAVRQQQDGSWQVEPGRLAAAAINRALVLGECEVETLAPERQSLQAVFEALLDEQLAEAHAT